MKFSNLFQGGSLIIIILAAVVVIAVLVAIVLIVKKNKQVKEPEPSILDVQNTGVNENQDFSYGYEKESTIVMQPLNDSSDTIKVETPVSDAQTSNPVENSQETQTVTLENNEEVSTNSEEIIANEIPEPTKEPEVTESNPVENPVPEVSEPINELPEVPVNEIPDMEPVNPVPEVSEQTEPLTEVPVSNIVETPINEENK